MSWPSLGDALSQAAAGNGTDLISLSTSYATGGSTNGGDANNAVNCLDHPVSRDPSTYPAINRTLRRIAPHNAEDPEVFKREYALTMAAHPELETIVDIVDADDKRRFANG